MVRIKAFLVFPVIGAAAVISAMATELSSCVDTRLGELSAAVVEVRCFDADGNLSSEGLGLRIGHETLLTVRSLLESAARCEAHAPDDKAYPVEGIVAESLEANVVELHAPGLSERGDLEEFPSFEEFEHSGKVYLVSTRNGLMQITETKCTGSFRMSDSRKFLKLLTPGGRELTEGFPAANEHGLAIGLVSSIEADGERGAVVIPAETLAERARLTRILPLSEWIEGADFAWLSVSERTTFAGMLLLDRGEVEKAPSLFKKSLEAEPDSAEAFCGLGRLHLKRKEWISAEESFEKALVSEPDFADAHVGLGLIALRFGDRNAAIENYRTARELDEEAAGELFAEIPMRIPRNLEECFLELDWILPEEEKENMRAGADTVMYHFGLGMWMRNNWGLWAGDRLAQHFNEMGIFHPDDMSAIILDAFQAHLKGEDFDLQEQIKYYQQYWERSRSQHSQSAKEEVKEDPKSAWAHMRLGAEYASEKNWEEAIKEFEQCILLDPEFVECYEDLARIHFILDQWGDGVKVCRRGIEANPDAGYLRTFLADHYAEKGQWENVVREMEALTGSEQSKLSPLGQAFFHLGRWDEAVETLKKSLESYSNDPEALYFLGASYARIDDQDSADEVCTRLSMLDEEKAEELCGLIQGIDP
ncbi:MAG: tetratricopeptide repeat protein [Acidobacteriota bacterium]|nr:MAG: tetratricopeptide repeat protein [Acidobacteriota bacterium]